MNNNDIHKQYIMITDDNRYELLDIHADITGKILDINLIEEVKPNEVVLLYHNAIGLEGGNEMIVDELAEYKSHYSDFRIQFRRYTSEEQLETCKDNKDNLLKTVLSKLLDLDE